MSFPKQNREEAWFPRELEMDGGLMGRGGFEPFSSLLKRIEACPRKKMSHQHGNETSPLEDISPALLAPE
jgi:hypothetical protein